MLFEIVSKYYGIDILAMICTFFGIYLIGNKDKTGFVVASIGNVFWVILGIITQASGLIIANSVILILYGRGFIKWKK